MSSQSVLGVQVVISPHVYGPSISLTTNSASGKALWTRLSQSFGYLNKVGYGKHVFAIAIGEFGTTFAEKADQLLFTNLAQYMLNVQSDGSPIDNLHNPITSFFWFAWNANSGDTGGLVNSPNWNSIVWPKIEYLQTLGLAPWYTGAAPTTAVVGAVSPGTPAVTVNTTPSSVPALTATPAGSNRSSPAPSTSRSPATPAAGAPISKPASPATTPKGTPSAPAPPAAVQMPCKVSASFTTVWKDPTYGPYMTSVSLLITNTGKQTVPVPWAVTVSSTKYTHVQYSWNWDITGKYNGRTVSGVATKEWLAIVPGANAVNLGYVAGSKSTTFMPTSVSINGKVCKWA